MAKVSGNIIYHVKKLIKENHGKEKYDEIVETTSTKTQEVLQDVIISTDWYDLDYYEEMLQASIQVLGEEQVEKILRQLAQKQFSGVFGFFIRMVTAEKVIERAPRMWRRLYSEGEFIVKEVRKDKITMQVREFNFPKNIAFSTEVYIQEIVKIVLKKDEVTSKARQISDKILQFDFYIKD